MDAGGSGPDEGENAMVWLIVGGLVIVIAVIVVGVGGVGGGGGDGGGGGISF